MNLHIQYMGLIETLTVISDGKIKDSLTFKKVVDDVIKMNGSKLWILNWSLVLQFSLGSYRST